MDSKCYTYVLALLVHNYYKVVNYLAIYNYLNPYWIHLKITANIFLHNFKYDQFLCLYPLITNVLYLIGV